jgi:hypothetical protein
MLVMGLEGDVEIESLRHVLNVSAINYCGNPRECHPSDQLIESR